MSEPFLGEIRMFGFDFAPRGWAYCDGSLLPINQYSALFSLLGTYYGGDGIRTFQLPNLQSRVAVGKGQGNGLTLYSLGDFGGQESITLNPGQMPAHTHAATGNQGGGNSLVPTDAVWASDAAGGSAPYSTAAPNVALSPSAIATSGGSLPHENRQPYLALNFCIALEGIYPSRG